MMMMVCMLVAFVNYSMLGFCTASLARLGSLSFGVLIMYIASGLPLLRNVIMLSSRHRCSSHSASSPTSPIRHRPNPGAPPNPAA